MSQIILVDFVVFVILVVCFIGLEDKDIMQSMKLHAFCTFKSLQDFFLRHHTNKTYMNGFRHAVVW